MILLLFFQIILETFTGEWLTETVKNKTIEVKHNEYTVALQGNFLGVKSCKNDVTEVGGSLVT